MEGLSRVAVVIPTWNEAGAIGAVVREVLAQGVGEVIVSDGGSTDGTQAVAREAGATVIDAGRGYGRACALGAERARAECDVVAFMDGDGADRPDQLERLGRAGAGGSTGFRDRLPRTRGEREPGSMNWHQVVAGALAGRLMGALYGVRYTDMCAYRVIPRTTLAGLGMTRDDLWLEHRDADEGGAGAAAHPGAAGAVSPASGGSVEGCRVAAWDAARLGEDRQHFWTRGERVSRAAPE